MGGALDDNSIVLVANGLWRENRLHRDHLLFEQSPQFNVTTKSDAVIAKEGVGCEEFEYGVDVQAGVRSNIRGNGRWKFERHRLVLLTAVAAGAAASAGAS
jgi:hypothetical protein